MLLYYTTLFSIFHTFIHLTINFEFSLQVLLNVFFCVFSLEWHNVIWWTEKRSSQRQRKVRRELKAVVKERWDRKRRKNIEVKGEGRGERRKNNRSGYVPVSQTAVYVCVWACVLSSITLSCQLLERLTLDKAQVSPKTEQPSRKREISCCMFTLSRLLSHVSFSLYLNDFYPSLSDTHIRPHTQAN